MYCKKCGSQLRDHARFCDRCGQPIVRTSYSSQRHTSQRGVSSGMSRSSGSERYERYRRQQLKKVAEQKRRRKRNIWIAVIIAVLTLVATGISVVATYQYYLRHSDPLWKTTDGPSQLNETAEATASAEPSETPLASSSPSPEAKTNRNPKEGSLEALAENAADRGCRIFSDQVFDFTCPYPEKFERSSLSGSKIKLGVKDPDADGEMVIYAEAVTAADTAKQLMKSYAAGIGTEASFNRAGDNWYALAFDRNGRYNYRRGIVTNGMHIYYDFSYATGSAEKDVYDGYMAYIDEYLNQYAAEANKKAASMQSPKN